MSDERIRLSREVPFGLIEFEQDPPRDNGYQHRAYYVTANGKRERYTSVTTLGRVLAKPALLRWYEQMGVETALAMERAGTLTGVAIEDATRTLRDNKLGAEAHVRNAALRGVQIHKIPETYFTDGTVPNPADYPVEHRGYVRAIVRWLLTADARHIEPEASEQLVAHPDLQYAGRYDLRARLGGLPHLIDFKTNKHSRVWPDMHYQPVAYAMADQACGAEPVYGHLIVAVGPNGDFEEMTSVADADDVRAIVDIQQRVARIDRAVKAARERTEAIAA